MDYATVALSSRAAVLLEKAPTDYARWAFEIGPRVGLASFAVATVTIERMAFQVVNTSAGALPCLTALDRWRIYRSTVGKNTALLFAQFAGTRELKFAFDHCGFSPAFSTMAACGLTGVPCSSLQYNWTIQDTYRAFRVHPPAVEGPMSFLRQKVMPGIFWAFARASIGTGGGLYYSQEASAKASREMKRAGLEMPAAATKVAVSLTVGAVFSLLSQWCHNCALVGGRMAVLGERSQAPHYTFPALRAAWREMGVSILYLNFPQRMVIQAVNVCMLSLCDIFYLPEISGWPPASPEHRRSARESE